MNPRGDTGDLLDERKRAIARRGISYYQTALLPSKLKSDAGLLFWCAQADIGEQFEHIQQKWANASNVPLDQKPTPDVDTVIGRLAPSAKARPQWDRWKVTSDIDYSIWDAIQLVGAEYFYAPSIDGFEALKERA